MSYLLAYMSIMLESKLITLGMTSTLQCDLCKASVDICEVCLRAGVACFCGWTAAVTVADFYLETRKNLEDHIRVRRSCFPSEVLVQKCFPGRVIFVLCKCSLAEQYHLIVSSFL